ncbi:MAG: SUMF1/EgtB/PvdO family nonheme iron enzyme, partial [Candidatus Aminicenantaceae bacterium]
MKERTVLDSWKEISSHFERSIKTCQRWESIYDMPVHRIDGSPKARVFAYRDELDTWLEDMLHHREGSKEAASFINKEIEVKVRMKRRNALILALVVLGVGFSIFAYFNRRAKVHWTHDHALPQIASLVELEDYSAAAALVERAEKYLPENAELKDFTAQATRTLSISTDPTGAEIFIRDYTDLEGGWELLGVTPLKDVRISRAFKRWRIVKEGFETVEGCDIIEGARYVRKVDPINLDLELDLRGSIPPGMVRVRIDGLKDADDRSQDTYSPFIFGIRYLEGTRIEDFYLDRHEVTNGQYQKFVDAGGYRDQALWKHGFVDGVKVLTWEEGIACLVDKSGQPGPATWENGTFPANQEDYPVSGVSWYEAAAFAEFAGKSLPTVYHWDLAAGAKSSHLIVPLSNYSLDGPASVGSYPGMGPFGNYDMAGNVKEWCWNEAQGMRMTLGGSFGEHGYMFYEADAASPFSRSPRHGFRCALYPGEQALAETVTSSLPPSPVRDFSRIEPASEREFDILKSVYDYENTPLDAEIDYTDDSHEDWIRQRITYNAAYNNERVIAYLFLPKNSNPPYQIILWFPGGGALNYQYIEDYTMAAVDYIVRSGRAVIYPIYMGTFERRNRPYKSMPKTESYPMLYKDLCRSIDYLETRSDIDVDKLAYTSFSWGTHLAAIFFAMEKRIKTGVLASGGFYPVKPAPMIDQVNFIGRVTQPILMLNGLYDYLIPEILPRRFFEMLGTPEEHKQLIFYPVDHSIPRAER